MFGYVRIAKPELKVKEYECYKAVYCSLCRELGKTYGLWSRFTLSYDFTFLALINMSLSGGCDPIEQKHCVFNPFKKCNFCKNSEKLKMPAAAAMIMSYYKLTDNIKDEKGLKKFGFICLKPLFAHARKKAAKSYPDIERTVYEYIAKQDAVEKENCSSLDKAADPTAYALGQILKECGEDSAEKRVLERIGYCVGRYIYILDAACDLEDDIKTGSYNCLKNEFSGNREEFIKKRILPQLYVCSNEAGKAFELLDVKKYKSILGNIIYLGLEDTFKKELKI